LVGIYEKKLKKLFLIHKVILIITISYEVFTAT